MPTGAVLLVRLCQQLPESELQRLRQSVMTALHLSHEDFRAGGPLLRCDAPEELPAMPALGGWLDANLWRAFYSPTYRRGDIDCLASLAEWLERHIPGAQTWYGSDTDYALLPFTPERRTELLSDYAVHFPNARNA